jgi:hypothetical protein
MKLFTVFGADVVRNTKEKSPFVVLIVPLYVLRVSMHIGGGPS